MKIGCVFFPNIYLLWLLILYLHLSCDITAHCWGDDSDVTEVTVCKTEWFLRLGKTIKPFFLLGHPLLLVDGCHSHVEPKTNV